MATLYVENVPEDLYAALRQRARANRNSIAAEVLSLLEQNVVTAAERKARQQLLRQAQRLRSRSKPPHLRFPATEEMQREDRQR